MAVAARKLETDAGPLEELIERFDPEVFGDSPRSARIRLVSGDSGAWDAVIGGGRARLAPVVPREPDALLDADTATWHRIANDLRGGMKAFRSGRLSVRRNLHLGVAFLAATSGAEGPGRLRFHSVKTRAGNLSLLEAGVGDPVVCLHGLGGTKASFLPTVDALADSHRVIAVDLPGFGDSSKPIGAPYDAPYFARTTISLLDELGLDQARLVGNSMGGRVALEAGLEYPDRVSHTVLLCPAMAWLNERRWAPLLKVVRPELGLIQLAPRPVVEGIVRRLVPGATGGWTAAGVDEFLRAFLKPRGRAAFYAAARNIYLDEPHGQRGFWTRLQEHTPHALFIWGRHDQLVPIAFMRHVERCLPQARHVELNCGHVPQLERPRETHAEMLRFFAT